MLFNSLDFLIFAALFFLLYSFLKGGAGVRYLLITVSSFIFYGWWDWRYLFLILISGCVDYLAGLGMLYRPNRRKAFLVGSLISNLTILFLFKYLLFFLSNVEMLFSQPSGALQTDIPRFFWVLPVGISFYTFQSLSYTIDAYRGKLTPTKNFLLFFSYLSMFPQLVAGPIVRAADVLDQLRRPAPWDSVRFYDGASFVVRGFFKKVVLADSLAPFVTSAFNGSPADGSALYWWAVMAAFAVQIYCDFSGYSDIAIGLARWMGIDFKLNFNHPYISASFSEFWTRWHISLSTWFRDYVYIPLGGSRCGGLRRAANTWITMLTSGLWHGASWNFVIWGAIHAGFISLERFIRAPRWLQPFPGLRQFLTTFVVFILVLVSWVFFRAHTLSQAVEIVGRMLDLSSFTLSDLKAYQGALPFILIALLRETYIFARTKIGWKLAVTRDWRMETAAVVLMLTACLFYRGPGSAFIYFQF